MCVCSLFILTTCAVRTAVGVYCGRVGVTYVSQVIKMAAIDADLAGGSYLCNCRVERTSGVGDVSNQPAEWDKLWALTEKCMKDGRFP